MHRNNDEGAAKRVREGWGSGDCGDAHAVPFDWATTQPVARDGDEPDRSLRSGTGTGTGPRTGTHCHTPGRPSELSRLGPRQWQSRLYTIPSGFPASINRAMAEGRWPGATASLLLLACASLCCVPFSHGRIVPAHSALSSPPSGNMRELPRAGVELDSDHLDSIVVSAYTAQMRGDVKGYKIQLKTQFSASEAQSISPSIGEILTRFAGTDSNRQSESHSISVIQGQKWKRTLGKFAEWILHACVVVLAVYVIFYTISCICVCCIGLDLLAEIWRILGGWQAFSYFVRVEQAVVETDPEPLPLLRSAVQP